MFEFKLYFGRLDEGVTGPASYQAGEGVENTEDESGIIGNQDETTTGALPNADDQVMGGMGTGEYGLSSGQFARGEIDVVEQMARTTRAADNAAHRNEDAFPGYAPEADVDATSALQDGMSTRRSDEDAKARHPVRGEGTGAFTDVGAGRSGVTRHH